MKSLRKIRICISGENWKSWILNGISVTKEVDLPGIAEYQEKYNAYNTYLKDNNIIFEKSIYKSFESVYSKYNKEFQSWDNFETEEEFKEAIKLQRFNKSFEDHLS